MDQRNVADLLVACLGRICRRIEICGGEQLSREWRYETWLNEHYLKKPGSASSVNQSISKRSSPEEDGLFREPTGNGRVCALGPGKV